MQIFIEGKGTIILLEIPRLGYEGAGVVEKTGANVQGISVGDPVVFADEKADNLYYLGPLFYANKVDSNTFEELSTDQTFEADSLQEIQVNRLKVTDILDETPSRESVVGGTRTCSYYRLGIYLIGGKLPVNSLN